MNRLSLTLFSLLAVATLGWPTSTAQAQCTGDEAFCASASVNVGAAVSVRTHHTRVVRTRPARSAQVIITTAPPPPPPQRVVIIQAAPPPPPPVVYIQAPPAPPPPPPPQPMVLQSRVVRPAAEHQRFGLHGQIGGVVGSNVQMGGFAAALRIRPVPHFGLDLGVGVYAGTDWNGMDRIEVPLTVDGLFFVNPEDRLQFYFLVGMGVSASHAEGFNDNTGDFESRDMTHVGGELGVGLEWRIGPHFALNTDVRAFLRHRTDDSTQPEFVNPTTGETTDNSAGAIVNVGATVYF